MGNIIIIVGPSGSGKSTIANYIEKNFNATQLTSTTSRIPREGEIEGINYYYKSKENFERMIGNNEFVEYSKYAGNYYGITKEELNKKLETSDIIVHVMDLYGALSIKKLYKNAIIIYCKAPISILMQRMHDRKDDFENIKKRVSHYFEEKEWEQEKYADYVLDNSDDIINSYNKVNEIILEIQNKS